MAKGGTPSNEPRRNSFKFKPTFCSWKQITISNSITWKYCYLSQTHELVHRKVFHPFSERRRKIMIKQRVDVSPAALVSPVWVGLEGNQNGDDCLRSQMLVFDWLAELVLYSMFVKEWPGVGGGERMERIKWGMVLRLCTTSEPTGQMSCAEHKRWTWARWDAVSPEISSVGQQSARPEGAYWSTCVMWTGDGGPDVCLGQLVLRSLRQHSHTTASTAARYVHAKTKYKKKKKERRGHDVFVSWWRETLQRCQKSCSTNFGLDQRSSSCANRKCEV